MKRKTLIGKIIIMALIASFIGIAMASSASAACGQYGKIEMMYTNATTGKPWVYFYVNPLRSSPLSSYYYYFRVEQNSFAGATTANVLSDAFAGSHTVLIYGNASSCPTSGSARYGGVVTYGYAYRTR